MRFPISPTELFILLPFILCLIAFVRFAKRSRQRQEIERAIKQTSGEKSGLSSAGLFTNLWVATTKPNRFFVYNAQRAPVLLILGLLALISIIEALPQFILWARMGLLADASALLSLSGLQFLVSSLSGFVGSFLFLLVMAVVIRFVAKLEGQAWIVAGYALSPFIVIGMVNALLTLLAMISPQLTLTALLTSGMFLWHMSPFLLGLVAFLGAVAAMVWVILPLFLSLRTFHAGVLAKAPGQATKATVVYLIGGLLLSWGVVTAFG